MSSVVLSDTATHVGHRAFLFLQKVGERLFFWKMNFSWLWNFEWYNVLHTINLPVNLSYINNRCFFECYKLNSIKMLKNWLKLETGLHVIVHHWIRLVRLQIWQKFLIFYLFFFVQVWNRLFLKNETIQKFVNLFLKKILSKAK